MFKLFKKAWKAIKSLFVNAYEKADEITKKLTPIAVYAAETAKRINESTAGDIIEYFLTSVIPGKTDDIVIKKARQTLRKVLPIILTQLQIVDTIAEIADPNEKFKAIIEAINLSPDSVKDEKYKELAGRILEALRDGNVTLSEAKEIAEYYYDNFVKNGN